MAYASRYGQALIDRQLYLPESWTDDPLRREAASIPEDMEFATKPAMARAMLGKALDAGIPCAWVLADAVYGSDYRLRRMREEREQPYVLAVRFNQAIRMLSPGFVFVETDPADGGRFVARGLAGASGGRRDQRLEALRLGRASLSSGTLSPASNAGF